MHLVRFQGARGLITYYPTANDDENLEKIKAAGWGICDGSKWKLDSSNKAIVTDEADGLQSPDLKGKFVLNSNPKNIGDIGGSNTETLTGEHIPAHNHSNDYNVNESEKHSHPIVRTSEVWNSGTK